MTLIDLQGKTLYLGNDAIKKAYLGNTKLYGESDLVLPGLPTIEPVQYAYFFGDGEITSYGTDTAIPAGLTSDIMNPNGLHPIDVIDVFSGPLSDNWSITITMENPMTNNSYLNNPVTTTLFTLYPRINSTSGARVFTLTSNHTIEVDFKSTPIDLTKVDSKTITLSLTQERGYNSRYIDYEVYCNGVSFGKLGMQASTSNAPNYTINKATLHPPQNSFVYYNITYSNKISSRINVENAISNMDNEFILTSEL